MNRKVMITCALTGAGDTVGRSEHVPVTPETNSSSLSPLREQYSCFTRPSASEARVRM